MAKAKYHAGYKVGTLTLLDKLENQQWRVKCDCGNVENRHIGTFSQNSPSCRICKKNKMKKVMSDARDQRTFRTSQINDKSGSEFGKWVVLEYVGNARYKCKCKNCGCIDHLITTVVNKQTDIRCYSCNPLKKDNDKSEPKTEQDVGFDMSFEDIANKLGVSRYKIYQIYKTAMLKIHKTIKDQDNKFDTLREYLDVAEQDVIDHTLF